MALIFAGHGGIPWAKYLDNVFGAGMGAKVTAKLGPVTGVSLLTDAVARGFAQDRDRGRRKPITLPDFPWNARPPIWDNEGGWLVHACLSESKRLATVRREVEELLADAEAAYATARGPVAKARARTTERRARTPGWDPFVSPRRGS